MNSQIPCPECQEYADMGWQEAGVLPDIGENCSCTSRCLCSWGRRSTPPPGLPGNVVNPPRPKPFSGGKVPNTGPNLPAAVAHLDTIRANQKPAIEALAADAGMSPEAYRRALAAKLKNAIGSGDFYVRVDPSVLPSILGDGRFRTVAELGADPFDVKFRATVEADVLGTPLATAPGDRPVYGYVSRRGFGSYGQPPESGVAPYGGISVRLKDSVRKRATVTGADSLVYQDDVHGTPAASPGVESLPVTARRFKQFHKDLIGANTPGKFLDAAGENLGYIEAQFHGGLTVKDIAEVMLPGPPDPALEALLKQHKIPWKVAP